MHASSKTKKIVKPITKRKPFDTFLDSSEEATNVAKIFSTHFKTISSAMKQEN